MWYGLRMSRRSGEELANSVIELVLPVFRSLILATGGIYLMWYLLAEASARRSLDPRFLFVAITVVSTAALSLWLLTRWLLAAQIVWQVGLVAAITLALHISRQPEVALFYAILPLMAIITTGWPAALLVEGLVIALLGWFPRLLSMPALPAAYSRAIVIGGVFTGLLGWAAMRTFLTAIKWHLVSLEQAQEKTAEARQHRAEVVRVLKDLDQAYYRLERTNEMLIMARAEAEEARDARNRFALAVSHELRTPLNFILGFSELMANSPETYAGLEDWPPGLHEDIQEIYRSTLHLSRLVNDILDLGQIEALRLTLIKDWVDPAQLVHEVAEMSQSAFARRGLWLRTEIEPDLPAVFVDRTRIRQVLLNLISNSLRVTEQGGVTVRARREENTLVLSVQDTGPGLAAEDISKVFEEFQQVGEGSWRRREGSGLGVPISRHFVELHGGRMWVESQPGKGASFYFTLPLAEAAAPLLTPGRAMSDTDYWRRLKEKVMSRRVLLVISPDPAAREVIERYTEGSYRVVAAPDLRQVNVEELLPDAIIIDRAAVQNREIEAGLEQLPYDVPILSFVFPGSADCSRALPANVVHYLVKPVGRHELGEAVRGLPDAHRLLIVDDDPAMVRFVTLALESEARGQYQLMTASTGREALQQLRAERPDAVLLDLALPDISGWQVLEEMGRDAELAQTPVILITAYDRPQASAEGLGEALKVMMRRPLARHELTLLLKCVLETVRPMYPTAPTAPTYPAEPFA